MSKLKSGKVVIWTKDELSRKSDKDTISAKSLLKKNNIEYEEIDFKKLNSYQSYATSLALSLHTGYSSFPNIYFGNEHIGGIDDLKFHFQNQKMQQKIMSENGIQQSPSDGYSSLEINEKK